MIELNDVVYCRLGTADLASAEQLHALVLAMLLDSTDASRIRLLVRARTIGGKHHVQLIRDDDRDEGEVPALVAALAAHAGGEASIAPGRDGMELAIELPVA